MSKHPYTVDIQNSINNAQAVWDIGDDNARERAIRLLGSTFPGMDDDTAEDLLDGKINYTIEGNDLVLLGEQ